MLWYYFDVTAIVTKWRNIRQRIFVWKGYPVRGQFTGNPCSTLRSIFAYTLEIGGESQNDFFFFEHTRVYASKRFATVRLRFSRDPLGFFSSTGWLAPVTLTRPTGFVLISFDESPWRWEKIVNTFAIRRMPAFDILATNYTTRIVANRVVSSHLLSLPIEFFFLFKY